MSARVLVVDDIKSNVRLLEALLTAEYFQVAMASSGMECLAMMDTDPPDIVLLDVMMPGMDGFEVCRRIKSNPKTAQVPVVMVTALDRSSDRINGLEAGADDFLTKPVDDIALLARVRSLVRQKMMVDELHLRESTAQRVGLHPPSDLSAGELTIGRILVIEDQRELSDCIARSLRIPHAVSSVETVDEAMTLVRRGDFDLIIVSLTMRAVDGMRLCSQIRAHSEGRNVPILAVTSAAERLQLARALEIGVNDYLAHPVDQHELVARVRTQLRKKHYADRLRHGLQRSLKMAITDELTGLHNRHFMSQHLESVIESAKRSRKPLSFVIMDIDFFKLVNDTYGHDTGDEVLKEFGRRVTANIRASNLACRFVGEELVVLMPDTTVESAYSISDRLRRSIETTPIEISRPPHKLGITISIGIAALNGTEDTAGALIHRADQALYRAKRTGRNRVIADAA